MSKNWNSAHLLDVVAIREHHCQPVDAHAPAGGGRQTILQRRAKVLVHRLRLIVARFACLNEAENLHEKQKKIHKMLKLGILKATHFFYEKVILSKISSKMVGYKKNQIKIHFISRINEFRNFSDKLILFNSHLSFQPYISF